MKESNAPPWPKNCRLDDFACQDDYDGGEHDGGYELQAGRCLYGSDEPRTEHSGTSHGNSFKIRYALKGTPFWGAYMTDIIKEVPRKDSNKFVPVVKTDSKKLLSTLNKATIAHNLKIFEAEISLLGSNPILIAFGDDAYKILKSLKGKYKILKLPHYSNPWKNIPKEQYREIVLEALRPYKKRAGE